MAELNGVAIDAPDLQGLALVNYGHFTSMRVDNQRVRGLSLHLDRLVQDCRLLFNAELSREKVQRFIRHATKDREGSFVVRVTIFDPALELGRPSAESEPKVLVTTRAAADWPLPPLRVQSATYIRELPRVKHVGLFGALWHRRVAQMNGFDDALFTDAESVVSEGGTWNIGFFDGNRIIWPDADVLPGVTMRLLNSLEPEATTAPVDLDMIPTMQAAFATNTAIGVRPIGMINDVELSVEADILAALQKKYREIPGEAL